MHFPFLAISLSTPTSGSVKATPHRIPASIYNTYNAPMRMDFDTSLIHPICQLQPGTPSNRTQYHALYPQQSSFCKMNRTPRLEGISCNQIPPENGIAEELSGRLHS